MSIVKNMVLIFIQIWKLYFKNGDANTALQKGVYHVYIGTVLYWEGIAVVFQLEGVLWPCPRIR